MKYLVTGFEPFGGEKVNPAWEAVKLLPDSIAGATLIKAQLPTVFSKGAGVLDALIQRHRPDTVLCLGQAGGRPGLSVERVAINLRDASIPDNEGNQPRDEPIVTEGRTAYFSNLPTRSLVEHLGGKGYPAALSYSAGTYVCNEVMYRLLYIIDTSFPKMRGGFIHVPYAPEQAAAISPLPPSLPIATVSEALRLALSFLSGT